MLLYFLKKIYILDKLTCLKILFFLNFICILGRVLGLSLCTKVIPQNILQDAGVTVLGCVPSLVKSWKAGNCAKGLDWTKIR